MKRFVIEPEIPGVGGLSGDDRKGAAAKSNAALAQIAPTVQWEHSYATGDKTFCVYLADDEAAIRKHAQISGFPASKISEVAFVFDPTEAG